MRTDEYGGSLANRLRFPLEVFAAVRAVWPQDRPMSVRISAHDWVDGGITADDAVEIARAFKGVGADMIDCSSGQVSPDQAPVYGRMYQTPFADRIHEEENWGQRLSGGEQQRLAIARALLDKPDWLFLDEATSALDEKLEAEIYAMLREQLPNTSIISIGHRSTLIGMHDSRIEMQPTPQGAFVPAPI